MAHSSSVFSRTPIELPNRSGFDVSHENMGTGTTGTLYPVLVDELLPNDTISLGANLQVQLPPMATDFYGRVDYVLEAFFVPCRLLWGGWESFMTHPTAGAQYPTGTPVMGKSKYMPLLEIPEAGNYDRFAESLGAGTLADYLGARGRSSNSDIGEITYTFNMLPFLAYHRIWDDWYRDSRIQSPLFFRPDASYDPDITAQHVSFKPYYAGGYNNADITYVNHDYAGDYPWQFFDGTSVMGLRQRNFAKDYFTTASYLPQAGNAATLTFEVDSNDTGTFSIAALRAANSLQKWMERNNIAGYRYSDQIYAQYGIYPSDAIMDKPIYLGRHVENVYTRSVFQTTREVGETTSNPFGSVGSKYGSSQVLGSGSLVDNIRVTEHGFLFVLASLVPHVNYSSGTRRYLKRRVVGDIAFPLLSGMGDQAIMKSELDSIYGAFSDVRGEELDEVFGYTDLYAEYKYHDDEVHGFLADGNSLSSFALQRSFSYDPTDVGLELGSEFLQIPKEFLDQVFATSTLVSEFSHWYDIYFTYKKVSTLPEYSLPTLADLKNVHTKYISRGGKRL